MQRYFRARAGELSLKKEGGLVIDFEQEMAVTDVRRFCDWILRQGYASVACVLAPAVAGKPAAGWNYTIGSAETRKYNLRACAGELNECLQGRGGGAPEMIQGSFRADRACIEAVLKQKFGD
jgi:alanyl-tRNA synthetase